MSATTAARRGPPQEVRIIGGQWKRSRLPVLSSQGLRPTPDRVRETLFNWLGQDLTGWRCVDAFAGSGALGLEAASRGAASVLMIESDLAAVRNLQAVKTKLQADDTVEIRRGDALSLLAALPPASAELVFLDPPYGTGLGQKALALLPRLLVDAAWVYLESDQDLRETVPTLGWQVVKHLRAGQVHAHLLQRPSA